MNAINSGFDKCRILAGFSNYSTKYKIENSEPISENGFYLNAYPNPFNGITTIDFRINVNAKVSLEIFSIAGIKIGELYNGNADANEIYNINFDSGKVEGGIYICKLITPDRTLLQRLVVIK